MKRGSLGVWVGVGIVGLAGWMLFAHHATAAGLAAPGDQAGTPATDVPVGTLLAPLLAAATGVERIIEMGWNWFESTAQQFVASIGLGSAWAQYAHDEVNAAEATLNQLATRARQALQTPGSDVPVDIPPGGTLAQQIDAAQQRLIDAQQQITGALKSQRYTSLKQSVSVVVGMILGLITAFSTGLDMFKLLHLSTTPEVFGIVLTGLIIGTGTGPVHSLIELLQQSKDAVDQAANLFSSRARQNAAGTFAGLISAQALGLAGAAPAPAAAAPRGLEAGVPATTIPAADRVPLTLGPGPVAGTAPAGAPMMSQEQIRTVERLARR